MDNNLLSVIFKNPAVDKFISKTGRLVVQDNLSLSYLLSASFLKSNKNISVVLDNLYFIGVGLVIGILIIAICAALDEDGFFDK